MGGSLHLLLSGGQVGGSQAREWRCHVQLARLFTVQEHLGREQLALKPVDQGPFL